jgi:hypothetical protein
MSFMRSFQKPVNTDAFPHAPVRAFSKFSVLKKPLGYAASPPPPAAPGGVVGVGGG